MKDIEQKISKVKPLLKAKEIRLESEAQILQRIRIKKREIVASMRESQQKYMDGVENLNGIRGSQKRDMLAPMEEALNHSKSRWYALYRDVQRLEKAEVAQLENVSIAQDEVKSVEKLLKKYEIERQVARARIEQKQMDETAVQRYHRNSQGAA